MPEAEIDCIISEFLTDSAQKNALKLIAYLKTNDFVLERYSKGYWKDKLYWCVKHNDEAFLYILVNNPASSVDYTDPWVIWFADNRTNWFKDFPLEEQIKKTAWRNVDVCGGNGSCGCYQGGGVTKTIFGKEFANVCITPFRFDNPAETDLVCVIKLLEIRKGCSH